MYFIPFCAVTLSVKNRIVMVKGKRGTLTKSFTHLPIEMIKESKKRLRLDIWFANRKQSACMKTVKGHIQNLFKGVTYGFLFKMKAVYAHFPINMAMSDDNTTVDIRNFLGEKYTRHVRMGEGVTCKPTGVKDEIKVEGNDLEKVSQSGKWIPQVTCAIVMSFSMLGCTRVYHSN